MLKEATRLTEASFKLTSNAFAGKLLAVDAKLLDEIDTIRRLRHIRLNVRMTVYNRDLGTYPVDGVSDRALVSEIDVCGT